jgi:putative transposase
MLITRTYKYKLYRSKKDKYLHNRINIAGIIYNHCIALHRRYYRLYGKHLNQYKLMKHITRLKRLPKYAYWTEVGSQAIQDIVQRIEKAYQLFYRNLKHGIKTSPPGFKKVKKYRSITLKQSGWKLMGDNRIKFGKKVYKYSKSRELPKTIKTVTIKRDALGAFWLCFSVQEEIIVPDRSGNNAVGFDFGLATFLVGSDNTCFHAPLYYHRLLDKLSQAQKSLSSKRKGSNNRNKARLNVVRIHQKIVNLRRDYFFKLAHELTDSYDHIFLEDLNLKGMQRLWGRKVSDLGHAAFVNILKYVALVKGKEVVFVDRFFPSSKTCHICGRLNKDLSLSDRIWTCACGATHDRDINAAVNILIEGASSIGLGAVRPAISGASSA